MKSTTEIPPTAHGNGVPSRSMLSHTRQEMIQVGGRLWQMLGLPRSCGQIYGLLYFSPQPLSLDDMVASLGISKGSASAGTRQLVAWGVIKQVWVPGERRDFFEAIPDLNQLIRAIYQEFIKRRIDSAQMRLDGLKKGMDTEFQEGLIAEEELELLSQRMKQLEKMQKKIQMVVPLVDKLML